MAQKSDSVLGIETAGKFGTANKWEGQEVEDSFIDFNDSKINNDKRGAANGVASLDGTGKVPVGQLPASTGVDICEITLASQIYAVVGVEYNLYWEDCVYTNLPIEKLGFRFGNGDTGGIGFGYMLEECYRLIAVTGNIGSYTADFNVYYKDQIIATKQVTINIVAASAGSGTKKILMIGDSTTVGMMPNSQFVTGGNYESDSIDFVHVGTQGSDPKKSEGRSGWNTYTFVSPGSPFVFGGVVDFPQYLSANSITMGAGDWVFINLGINDYFSPNPIVPSYDLSYMNSIVNSIKAHNANINVAIGLTFLPAKGFNYLQSNGAIFDGYTYLRRLHGFHNALITEYDSPAKRTAKIFCLNTHTAFDKVTGFNVVNGPKHSRDTGTYNRYQDYVHPNSVGSLQLWDFFYSTIKCNS